MIEIPLPPSHHHKNKQAKAAWRDTARVALVTLQRPTSRTYELVLDFYGPWQREDGTIDPKMPDCKNLLWELEDLIAEVLGYNDRANFRVVLNKIRSDFPRCTVWLRPCPVISPGQ